MRREFTAQIVDDFKTAWIIETAKDEGITTEAVIHFYGGNDLNALHDRISGKRVTLVECTYQQGVTDCFEKKNNDFVIHKNLFVEVKGE